MKLRSIAYHAFALLVSLLAYNVAYAASSGSNQITPHMSTNSQVYGTYQYVFTITVRAPLDGVVGVPNTYGTYYASCPPGSDAYYPPGYLGPANLTISDAQVYASSCGYRWKCGTNINMSNDGYGRIVSSATCSAKTSGWVSASVVKAASQSGMTGYFGLPVLTGYHYEIQATSLWRHVVPEQSVVIPGFDMNPDLNSVYVQSKLN